MKVGIVSQYTEVYCDCGARARLDCIAIQWPAKPRYTKGWAAGARAGGAGRAARRAGRAGQVCRDAQALGHRLAQGRAERNGRARQGEAERCRARQGAAGARPGRWAHGQPCCWAGFGLCTRCTRPVFGPVRLGIFPESLNEHCSL